MAVRSAYGPNPNAGVDPNADHGWGGYQWPKGVPASLLATLRFTGKAGVIVLVGRRELMPLVAALMRLSENRYGYRFHVGWCWSYENRPITGSTTRASNHSRGRAFDFNAPNNPYSLRWACDMPPAMVRLWETHGFYWGGRYTGQPTDPMHMEYIGTPASVAAHLADVMTSAELPAPTSPPSRITPPTTVPTQHPTAKPPAKPPAKPYTAPPGTRWPLPAGSYFGLKTGPAASHGGGVASDLPWVRWIQTRITQLGYGRLAADGNFGPATKAGVAAWQRARHAATTSRPGEVWSDDFAHLQTDR